VDSINYGLVYWTGDDGFGNGDFISASEKKKLSVEEMGYTIKMPQIDNRAKFWLGVKFMEEVG